MHTNKINVQLNNALQIISGTVKSTQLQWLPVLANFAPAKLRREANAVRELVNCRKHAKSLLYELMLDIPAERLISRHPFWSLDPFPSMTMFPISENWLENWSASLRVNGDLILDPIPALPVLICDDMNGYYTT
jgi:hypothetical protein